MTTKKFINATGETLVTATYFASAISEIKVIAQAAPAGPAGPSTYDFHNFINGKPLAKEILMRAISCRALKVPANCDGSYAFCSIAATTSFEIELLKNGVAVGSLVFATNSTNGVFTMTTSLTLNPGDQFSLRCAPAVQDATLSDITIAIKGETV